MACEFTGAVRDAFIARGAYAMSCDLMESENPGPHYRGDVRDVMNDNWDLLIAHPPCHDICSSGARWFSQKKRQQRESLEFVRYLFRCGVKRICIENPVGLIGSMIRPASQYIHPWMFGDPFEKRTGLWLVNLPKLKPTNIVEPPLRMIIKGGKSMPAWYAMSPKIDRRKERSRTFPGIANAMAEQWLDYIQKHKEGEYTPSKTQQKFFDL